MLHRLTKFGRTVLIHISVYITCDHSVTIV
jgi:hypothetical protein